MFLKRERMYKDKSYSTLRIMFLSVVSRWRAAIYFNKCTNLFVFYTILCISRFHFLYFHCVTYRFRHVWGLIGWVRKHWPWSTWKGSLAVSLSVTLLDCWVTLCIMHGVQRIRQVLMHSRYVAQPSQEEFCSRYCVYRCCVFHCKGKFPLSNQHYSWFG